MALPEKQCERAGCSVRFKPERSTRKYCGPPCRAQVALDKAKAARMAGDGAPAPVSAGAETHAALLGTLVENTRAQLERAGVADSPMAATVLALANRIEHGYQESAPAFAALTKAFDAALVSAVARSEDKGDVVVEARRSAQQKRFRLAARRTG